MNYKKGIIELDRDRDRNSYPWLDSALEQGFGDLAQKRGAEVTMVSIGIDPGETTGLALTVYSHPQPQFRHQAQVCWYACQVRTPKGTFEFVEGVDSIWEALQTICSQEPDIPITITERFLWQPSNVIVRLIIESYHIYSWKSQSHIWSDIHTIQVIGAIKYLLATKGILRDPSEDLRVFLAGAQRGKAFYKDKRLIELGVYENTKGMPHARDAIRHALHHLTFDVNVNDNDNINVGVDVDGY